ncbi:high-affinity nickel transporter [Phlyctochytrium arcticum]|nr:high-affinity nickel transporter [Phlyctochytrium arcticum]
MLPHRPLSRFLGNVDPVTARKAILIVFGLVLINAALWISAWLSYAPYPDSRAILILAWTLGLRHAVDADHIAAIDNVTRKLTQEGRKPVTVGLWFALGHSTVVVVAAIIFAVTAKEVAGGEWGITGTIVSATFLFLIAAINLVSLIAIWRGLRNVRNGNDRILKTGGVIGRWFRRVYNFINAPWKMYPLGLLFGLGFDTATEISLLAISAAHAGSGMPLGLVLFLPALFTAGMTLIDTMDGIAMVSCRCRFHPNRNSHHLSCIQLAVYAWANIHPAKKLYYNFIVTLLSVLIAFIVGIIQVLSIVGEKYELSGGIWDVVGGVGENSDTIGFVIIATFMLMLIVSAMVYRFSGLRNVDQAMDVDKTVTDPNTLEEQGLVRSDSSTALGSQHGHEKGDVTVITVSNDRTANHEQGQSPPHSEIVVN